MAEAPQPSALTLPQHIPKAIIQNTAEWKRACKRAEYRVTTPEIHSLKLVLDGNLGHRTHGMT